MKFTTLLFLILNFLVVRAYSSSDSLWSAWNNNQLSFEDRARALDQFIWKEVLFAYPDSAYHLASMQYDFALTHGLEGEIGKSLNIQGIAMAITSNYDESIKSFKRALKFYEDSDDFKGISSALNNLGNVYADQGDYIQAVNYFGRSAKLSEQIGDSRGVAVTFHSIAIIYDDQNDMNKSLEFHLKSLAEFEQLDDIYSLSSSLISVGSTYRKLDDIKSAELYLNRALEYSDSIKDKTTLTFLYNSLGYLMIDKFDQEYDILKRQEYKDLAFDYINRSLLLRKELNDRKGIANSYLALGRLSLLQHNYKETILYANKSKAITDEIVSPRDAEVAFNLLYKAYKAIGSYKDALNYFEQYIDKRDFIVNERNKEEIIRQEYKFEYEKQAIADSIQNAEAQKLTEARLEAQEQQIARERLQRISLYGGIFLLLVFGGFMYNRFRVTHRQKLIIEEKEQITALQNSEIKEKNKEILDSITYAKRLQDAILPASKVVKSFLMESFILYKPKDIVAGDFYFMDVVIEDGRKYIYYVAADCTGHGVPGAMVSIVGANGLKRCIQEFSLRDPGEILDKLSELVTENFIQSEERIRDGMDLALCCLELEEDQIKRVHYSGANNPLWIVNHQRNVWPDNMQEFKETGGAELKATKQAIGYNEAPKRFVSHTVELQAGDTLYTFSDGYVDQFGGEAGKKFKAANFRKFLLSIQDHSMDNQMNLLNSKFEEWKGLLEQVDDVCVIGVRI